MIAVPPDDEDAVRATQRQCAVVQCYTSSNSISTPGSTYHSGHRGLVRQDCRRRNKTAVCHPALGETQQQSRRLEMHQSPRHAKLWKLSRRSRVLCCWKVPHCSQCSVLPRISQHQSIFSTQPCHRLPSCHHPRLLLRSRVPPFIPFSWCCRHDRNGRDLAGADQHFSCPTPDSSPGCTQYTGTAAH